MQPRLLLSIVSFLAGLSVGLAQSASQLSQKAAEMERDAAVAQQQGDNYVRSGNRKDADFFYAQAANLRAGAARLRGQASAIRSSGAPSMSVPTGGDPNLAQWQGMMNTATDMVALAQSMRARREAQAAATADQAEYEHQAQEAEREREAALKRINDQQKLDRAKAEFAGLYDPAILETMHTLDAWAKDGEAGSARSTWRFFDDAGKPAPNFKTNAQAANLVDSLIFDKSSPLPSNPAATTPRSNAAAADSISALLGLPPPKPVPDAPKG